MSWKSLQVPTGGEGGDFFKLVDGDNKLRLASYPLERRTHFDRAAKRSYQCEGKNCRYCGPLGPYKNRYLFYVIDLKDKTQKLLEVGVSIVSQLRNLTESEEYAHDSEVWPYYINIQKKGSGLDTEYTVIAARTNTELSEEEKKLIAERKPLSEVIAALDKKSAEKSPSKDDEIDVDKIPF